MRFGRFFEKGFKDEQKYGIFVKRCQTQDSGHRVLNNFLS